MPLVKQWPVLNSSVWKSVHTGTNVPWCTLSQVNESTRRYDGTEHSDEKNSATHVWHCLRTGVGSPSFSLKATVDVMNDSGVVDSLTGGSGNDWYCRAVDDIITDLVAGEVFDLL
jgi:hypothetical protein